MRSAPLPRLQSAQNSAKLASAQPTYDEEILVTLKQNVILSVVSRIVRNERVLCCLVASGDSREGMERGEAKFASRAVLEKFVSWNGPGYFMKQVQGLRDTVERESEQYDFSSAVNSAKNPPTQFFGMEGFQDQVLERHLRKREQIHALLHKFFKENPVAIMDRKNWRSILCSPGDNSSTRQGQSFKFLEIFQAACHCGEVLDVEFCSDTQDWRALQANLRCLTDGDCVVISVPSGGNLECNVTEDMCTLTLANAINTETWNQYVGAMKWFLFGQTIRPVIATDNSGEPIETRQPEKVPEAES
eukprot:CAMPEP_0184513526 /NCGR_PEP_ID=MMETSP0198_2-20121128/3470_1 /TAXON_ID=1112570 /ORGANISM="Thraustochytrium sp., Strain LLF1b" /LENGTH=302 /DNA_ID=CAMNT_0026903641 /DNA_START=859 /DNA_END=1767 /DNA_ORIENTATION=-